MPGDDYLRPRPGDPFRFPARLYCDLLDLVANDKRGQGAIVSGAIARDFANTIIQIKNGTGSNLPRFSVLGFNGTVITVSGSVDSFKDGICLIGRTPSLPADSAKWAITLEPIADGNIGYAVIAGVCLVQVNVIDANDQYADAIDSDNSKLKSSASGGAQILYKESGTGTKWAVVRFPFTPISSLDVKLTAHTQDGTNKRWKYDWVEVEKTSTGYGGWTNVSGGRSGSGSDFDYAYNSIENGNGASGLYGNGVNSTHLTGSLDIQPAPANTIVRGQIVYISGTDKPEVWFEYANGIDGACS